LVMELRMKLEELQPNAAVRAFCLIAS
jgi:hypothetical protein